MLVKPPCNVEALAQKQPGSGIGNETVIVFISRRSAPLCSAHVLLKKSGMRMCCTGSPSQPYQMAVPPTRVPASICRTRATHQRSAVHGVRFMDLMTADVWLTLRFHVDMLLCLFGVLPKNNIEGTLPPSSHSSMPFEQPDGNCCSWAPPLPDLMLTH
jgi:hypothetical protein